MRLKNGLRKKTIKTIKTILLIMNDKEKIKEALELLNKLIENNEKKGSEWRRSENSLISIIYTDQIKELEAIKKTLEE